LQLIQPSLIHHTNHTHSTSGSFRRWLAKLQQVT